MHSLNVQMERELQFSNENGIHCSKKLKEHFENTSDLNVKKYYVGYLY